MYRTQYLGGKEEIEGTMASETRARAQSMHVAFLRHRGRIYLNKEFTLRKKLEFYQQNVVDAGTYSAGSWNPRQQDIDILEQQQYKHLCCMMVLPEFQQGSLYTNLYEALEELHIPFLPIEITIRRRMLSYIGHVLRYPEERVERMMLFATIIDDTPLTPRTPNRFIMTHEQAHRDAITAFGWDPVQWFPFASDRSAQSKKLYADDLLLRAATIAYPAWKTRRKEASELKRSNAERALMERSTTATVALLELGDASWHEVDIQLDVSPAYEEDEPPRPQPGTAPNNPPTVFATMRASIRAALQGTMEETFTQNTPRRAHQNNPRQKKLTTLASSNQATQPDPEHHIAPSFRSFTASQTEVARIVDRQTVAGSLISLHEGPTKPAAAAAATADTRPDTTTYTTAETPTATAVATHTHGRRKLDELDPGSLTARQGDKIAQAKLKKARTAGSTALQPHS